MSLFNNVTFIIIGHANFESCLNRVMHILLSLYKLHCKHEKEVSKTLPNQDNFI